MLTLLAPFATSARTRRCGHGIQASHVALVDTEGKQVTRVVRIANLDVIEFTALQRGTGSDVIAFVAADGCRFTEPCDLEERP